MRATFSPHANMLRGVCAVQFGMLILASSAVASYVILAGDTLHSFSNDTCNCHTSPTRWMRLLANFHLHACRVDRCKERAEGAFVSALATQHY